MAPSLREDPLLPHDYMRVRVHGPILVIQPYKLKYCSGSALLIDLLRGTRFFIPVPPVRTST